VTNVRSAPPAFESSTYMLGRTHVWTTGSYRAKIAVMSLAEPGKPPSSRRAIRPIRINAALLAIALAPLVYSLCANLVTGGSFTAALKERNWWIFLVLLASGAIYFASNYKEAAERQQKVPPDKRSEDFARVIPLYDRAARRALESSTDWTANDSQAEDHQERAASAAAAETVEGLVEDLFRNPAGGFRPGAYKAAWRLAALLASSNARAALRRLDLTKNQMRQPRLEWLTRPDEGAMRSNDPLNVVQGRVGYLLRDGGLEYLPSTSLAVDPYLAGALIAVRQDKAEYHSHCLVHPHRDDADIIRQLYHAGRPEAEGDSSPNHLDELAYQDLGKLIRPDLPHTNPQLAARQAELLSHVMRHFLDDDLSAVLFDALSPRNQVRLAISMLTASQWMSPGDWQYWVRTGRDRLYSPKLEAASDLSFAASGVLALGVVVLGCWQLVSWINYGWSWYFGSAHLLITWPGWLKVFAIVAAIALCIIWLYRIPGLGIAVAISAAIGLVISILASPIVRLHVWGASWETASTVVVCAAILVALLAWLGIFYSDRRFAEEPVQLGGFARGRLSRMSPRDRFRPSHEAGHSDWCALL